MERPVISFPIHGPPSSSALEYLKRISPTSNDTSHESDLLKSIRIALRGSDTESISTVHSTSFLYDDDLEEEDELTWNAHTVILGRGGVMRKKWNFEEEGQSIQWACIGWLEQNVPKSSIISHSAAHYTSKRNAKSEPQSTNSPATAERKTFGPFAQVQQNSEVDLGTSTRVAAVFIFLRSIGKLFLKTGIEYTFSLPFIVRKAWPLSPHGVMIQRVLEMSELDDAEFTGDAVLPTIFSVTSPFSEAGTVGLTTGILGGYQNTAPSLKDEDENSTKPLKSIAPTEMVVWASHRGPASDDDILVTVDVEKRQLSIWRYVYIKQKDTPVSLGSSRAHSMAKKRQSMTGVGSRRSSAILGDMADRRHPLSPNVRSREQSPTLELSELPPLSALPGMPPALSAMATMASLVSGGPSSQWSAPAKGRRNSLTRNDLSVTMDRMVLGGRLDSDAALAPIEHGRMKAAYWMERLYSQDIIDLESVHEYFLLPLHLTLILARHRGRTYPLRSLMLAGTEHNTDL
jgi:anaphase-promoting complex subunit 1